MVRKNGLGKGLDSLIPSTGHKKAAPAKPEVKKEVVVEKVIKKEEVMVKITEVEPNREQPRKNFNEDALLELADSIKQFGIIQPLVVQKQDDYYEIIAGERRWRAAKLAGLKEVPVIIKNYTEQERVEIALIENIQREDLNPIEEAMAFKRLLTEFDLKQDELAERVSKSRTAVTNSMRLLKLDERVQQGDKEQQYNLANKIFDEKLSVRETERLMKNLQKEKKDKKDQKAENEFIYKGIEEKIKMILGTKVTVNHKKNNKGRIEIEYYSNEELERIMDLLESIHQEA